MKNDVDLIRAILSHVRDRNDAHPRPVKISGYDEALVARHLERLLDDGMIDGLKFQPISGMVTVLVADLTSRGHEFLSAVEKEDVWVRLKSALSPSELGALSLKKLAGIAGELAEQAIRKKLGLD